MNTPALPRDGKTLKLAALIALGLFGILSLFAILLQRFHPEREQREINRKIEESTPRSMPPEVQRQFQKFFKEN